MGKPNAYHVRRPRGKSEYATIYKGAAKGYASKSKTLEIAPLFAIDDDTREALKVAVHALKHNMEHSRYFAERASATDRKAILTYSNTQGRAAITIDGLLSGEA